MKPAFDNDAAFDDFAEPVTWRQDKKPHATGTFDAIVLHGETQSDSTGPSRDGFPADPWSVIVNSDPAACVGMEVGDTITVPEGTVLTVQQISRDKFLGWVIRCTANARVPIR